MVRRPSLTGGLKEDQALAIEQILEKVGSIAEPKLLAERLGLNLKRLSGFLKTSRAKHAASKATDLSRSLYRQELRDEAGVEELQEDSDVICPETPSDLREAGMHVYQAKKGRSRREIDTPSRHERNADKKNRDAYFERVGADITPEEADKWDRLADGR